MHELLEGDFGLSVCAHSEDELDEHDQPLTILSGSKVEGVLVESVIKVYQDLVDEQVHQQQFLGERVDFERELEAEEPKVATHSLERLSERREVADPDDQGVYVEYFL